ncbi:nuclear transport factor 2 family protein [Flavobacterium psychrophilum]|uniref:nuclear transport factor 2 family protein n=1 Tax=Flavobacterium psychrophilum TaxID=96345 RepID=UPI00061875BD|nr:nuclear transport factor 2 family protein [Flavobacterium psychrophilum]OAE90410.1 hypothetical protein SU65_11765 [Flavobacterium psychrophilum]
MENQNSKRTTWENYANAWSETNESSRLQVLGNNLVAEATYSDPNIETIGHTDLSNYMVQFQQNFGGAKFVTTTFVEHHNQALIHWNMENSDGNVLVKGASFVKFNDEKLASMTGFFFQ